MKPISTEQFIKKAKEVHRNVYDYNEVLYMGNRIPVKIVCNLHGPFHQKPVYHIQRKSGCPQCYRDSQKCSEETFLKKAKSQFGSQFTYGKYVGYRNNIEVTCKDHGSFITTPAHHLIQDGGCKHCRSEKLSLPPERWISRFREKHGNKYDYSCNVDIKSDKKIKVKCPEHGYFFPTANNHIRGHGCPTCACQRYVGGYSEDFFEKNPHKKNEPGIFYVVRLWDEHEDFIKVGITNRSIELRFKNKLPYNYEIIMETPMSLYEAHIKEQLMLEQHPRYTPVRRFSGWTECLSAAAISNF